MTRNLAFAPRKRRSLGHRYAATTGLVAALLTCVSCIGGGGSATDSTSDPTAPTSTLTSTAPVATPRPAPKVGECRSLSFADISKYSNNAKPGDCKKAHTGYTFAVKELPSDVAFDGVEIQNNAVQDAAAQACNATFTTFIGGDAASRVLSRLTVTYFLPMQRDFDLGAHWVRCDVIAMQSANVLASLPKKVEGFLNTDDALKDYGVCSQGEPGEKSSALVMCTQDHDYRALSAIRLGGPQAPYPGADQTVTEGKQTCRDLVSDTLGVTGGYTYSWTYPSQQDWDGGSRFGFCWNKQGQ